MFFIYSDNEPRATGGPPSDIDPVFFYLKHYENYLFLKFIANNSDKTLEKLQAQKELLICDRKIEYWRRRMSPAEWKLAIEESSKKANMWKGK